MTRACYAALLSGCALAGCNSVLGIEEGKLRDEGGTSNVEASAGDAAPPRALDCAFVFTAHRTIADQSSQTGPERTYSDQLFAEAVPSAGIVRLVAYHAGANLPFDLFSVDAKDNGNSTKVASVSATPLDMQRIDPSSVGLLTVSTTGAMATLTNYAIADADGSTPNLVAGAMTTLGMVDQVTGLFLPVPPGDIAYTASYRSSPTQFDLVLGRASVAGQSVLQSGPAAAATNPRAIVRVGKAIHVFFGDGGNPTGSNQVTLVDGMTPSPPRSLGPPSFFLISASSNPAGTLNVAFAELGANINLRIGQIDPAKIGSFTGADVPIARQYPGLADIPYTTRPRWFGDALVAIGPTSAAGNELTIQWGDPRGSVQAEKKLLTAQKNGRVRTSAFAGEQQLGPLGGIIDLFWIETYQPDDAGQAYDVLYYDQVRCL